MGFDIGCHDESDEAARVPVRAGVVTSSRQSRLLHTQHVSAALVVSRERVQRGAALFAPLIAIMQRSTASLSRPRGQLYALRSFPMSPRSLSIQMARDTKLPTRPDVVAPLLLVAARAHQLLDHRFLSDVLRCDRRLIGGRVADWRLLIGATGNQQPSGRQRDRDISECIHAPGKCSCHAGHEDRDGVMRSTTESRLPRRRCASERRRRRDVSPTRRHRSVVHQRAALGALRRAYLRLLLQ